MKSVVAKFVCTDVVRDPPSGRFIGVAACARLVRLMPTPHRLSEANPVYGVISRLVVSDPNSARTFEKGGIYEVTLRRVA